MQIGGLGALGLSLPGLLRAGATAAEKSGSAEKPTGAPSPIKSCILLFYYGGPSHLDTWDMKPNSPRETRGEFQSIDTTAPGVRVCEQMPKMDRVAVIRGMHHPMTNHNAAAVEALCGRTPLKGDLELLANDPLVDFPCYGSALSHLLPDKTAMPPHIALPHIMYNVVMPSAA
jgi:hypothetical protein